jgi:hypothetical protein
VEGKVQKIENNKNSCKIRLNPISDASFSHSMRSVLVPLVLGCVQSFPAYDHYRCEPRIVCEP